MENVTPSLVFVVHSLAGLRPNSEIIGNVGISKFFLCNLVHYSKSSLHTNFEVRRRQRRREIIETNFKIPKFPIISELGLSPTILL